MAEDWLLKKGEAGERLAEERHARYLNDDPFPQIESSLLGSAAFLKYIQTPAMVHPFRGWDAKNQRVDTKLVKPASYEMRPGKSFFRYDQAGNLIAVKLVEDGEQRFIRLPANSPPPFGV